jgi:hypothetical protein
MVIAIEYISDFLVGPPLFSPNLSGFRTSGAVQRKVQPISVVDVSAVPVFELRSPATLVNPTSVKQARPSSWIKMFAYMKFSTASWKQIQYPHPFQVAMGEFYTVEIQETACSIL